MDTGKCVSDFCGEEYQDQTQDPAIAKQMLYHRAISLALGTYKQAARTTGYPFVKINSLHYIQNVVQIKS